MILTCDSSYIHFNHFHSVCLQNDLTFYSHNKIILLFPFKIHPDFIAPPCGYLLYANNHHVNAFHTLKTFKLTDRTKCLLKFYLNTKDTSGQSNYICLKYKQQRAGQAHAHARCRYEAVGS